MNADCDKEEYTSAALSLNKFVVDSTFKIYFMLNLNELSASKFKFI